MQVALGAVAKNLCCLTVPAFTCLRKLPGRQAWYWTVAQVRSMTTAATAQSANTGTPRLS